MSDPWVTVLIPCRNRLHGVRQQAAYEERASIDSPPVTYRILSSPGLLVEKWHAGVMGATTPWVLLGADDVEVLTPQWDAVMHIAAQTMAPLGLIHANDGHFRAKLAILPMIPTKVAQSLIWPPYGHYCFDDHLHDIFKRLNRVLYLPDVQLVTEQTPQEPKQYQADRALFMASADLRADEAARLQG